MAEENVARFDFPTVGDIIAYLSTLPAETPFRIEDPDTNWEINIVHAYVEQNVVWLTGKYGEMNSVRNAHSGKNDYFGHVPARRS